MITKLFWVLLTVVFTFMFMVLFENGPVNYVQNCQTEYEQIRAYFGEKPTAKKPDSGERF